MDGPRDFHSKWSKLERQTPWIMTYMWDLKYSTNGHIYENRNRLIDREHRLVIAEEERGWWGGGLGSVFCIILKNKKHFILYSKLNILTKITAMEVFSFISIMCRIVRLGIESAELLQAVLSYHHCKMSCRALLIQCLSHWLVFITGKREKS